MEFEKDVKNPPDSTEESARDLAGTTNMTTSMTDPRPRSMTGSSSDNESWTILDEDDQENDRLVTLNTRIDVIKATAQFTKREFDQNTGPGHHFESDSDIETIDEKNAESNCESLGLNSIHSDGIPYGEELSESGAQYLWSSDTDLTISSSTQTTTKKVDSDEIHDEEDDLDIADDKSNHNDDEVDETKPKIDSISSGYPTEELMERFAEIVKGRTYLHRPNQSLNLYLTAALAVSFFLVIGLGFGHFKGWSERLELQEQYADVREERMDELTDSLVTCMTGEEGRGGEDQDLDDLVIRQLRDENELLKFELQMLREITDQDNSATEEITVILRDRINDLLLANADLEKEVGKLKYAAPPQIFYQERSQDTNEEDKEELIETKASLNNMFHENDQLKLAIAKERYGPRQVPIEAKVKLNILQTENEELKTEVRKFRYGVNNQFDFDEEEFFDEAYNTTEDDSESNLENIAIPAEPQPNFVTLSRVQNKPILPSVIPMGGRHREAIEEETMEELNEPNFVTLSRVQNKPILPPVIAMGGRLREAIEEDTKEELDDYDEDEDDDEGFVEDYFEENEEVEPLIDQEDIIEEYETIADEDANAEIPDYFQSFTENVDMKKVAGDFGKIFSLFEKNAKDMIPDSKQIEKIKKGAEQLGNVFKEKWQELEKNTKYFLPETDHQQIQKFRQSAEELGTVLKQKWNELDWIKEKDHLRHKLTKTISKALYKAKDVIEDIPNIDGQTWSQRLNRVQDIFQSKWDKVISKFSASKNDTCKGTEKKDKKDVTKKKQKHSKKSNSEDKSEKEVKRKDYSSWSKKETTKRGNSTSNSGEAASWLFERAKKRDAKRKENKKSDWLFERASSRKRFHNLLTESEWYNRRLYNKYCDDGDCTTIDQESFHVKKGQKNTQNKDPQQKHRGETEPLKNRQGFKFSNNFEDDLDDNVDEKKEENYNRVHKTERNFGKTQRRQHDNTQKRPQNNKREFEEEKKEKNSAKTQWRTSDDKRFHEKVHKHQQEQDKRFHEKVQKRQKEHDKRFHEKVQKHQQEQQQNRYSEDKRFHEKSQKYQQQKNRFEFRKPPHHHQNVVNMMHKSP